MPRATLAVLLPLCAVPPQEPSPGIPREALGSFERKLAELAERASIPGMSAAVVHRRRVVWSAGYGHADLEERVFAEPTTRYRTPARSSAGLAWTASGVRASPFARAFLSAFVPPEGR